MTAPSALDRAARALLAAQLIRDDYLTVTEAAFLAASMDASDERMDGLRLQARAVLAALDPPTQAMVEAAEAVELEAPDNATSRDVLIAQYAAMLDALLEEPTDG